jgi:hypothetical protein
MITVNALANILPINGLNTGQISDQFKVYFVPAGYVFSIWGLIYLLLTAYAIYQAFPAQKTNPVLRKIGWWYVVGSAANAVWIVLWHYQLFPLTLVMMGLLLATLLVIHTQFNNGKTKPSKGIRWFAQFPFSIYLGWITVATIANVTDVLEYLGWRGFGMDPVVWAVIMLGVAVIIAALMAFTRRDWAFLSVLIWAFIGIGQKFRGLSPLWEAAFLAAGAVAVFWVIILIKRPQFDRELRSE